jgi:hypothetical protein
MNEVYKSRVNLEQYGPFATVKITIFDFFSVARKVTRELVPGHNSPALLLNKIIAFHSNSPA